MTVTFTTRASSPLSPSSGAQAERVATEREGKGEKGRERTPTADSSTTLYAVIKKIRSYKEHKCNYIFRFKQLDLAQ